VEINPDLVKHRTGGYRGGFCEKLLEASPVSGTANASQLQDGAMVANHGSTSVIMYLRKEKTPAGQWQLQLERGVR